MDPDAKKKLLRRIPCGLYVVGLRAGDERHGFTASWFSQVSMKPPCVMVGVRSDSRSFEMMKEGKVFSVNFIRKQNKATLEHFFKPSTSRDGDRLGSFPCETGSTGAPILKEAVGFLECEVRKIVDGFGDHAVVVAEVVNARLFEDVEPLVMADTPWHYGG